MEDEKVRQLRECLGYFRGKRVYRILFEKVREKYRSLGHLGGSVTLTGLGREEKEQLGGFLQKNFIGNKTVTVSAASLGKALKNSRFSALSWEEILEDFFGEPLVGKKEELALQKKEQELFFEAFEKESPGGRWLFTVLEEKGEGYQLLIQNYGEVPIRLKEALEAVLKAAARLPVYEGKRRGLALFAADITGNPHYFDEGTLGERLLSLFIRWNFQIKCINELSRAEYKSSLLFTAGILKDDISSYAIAYGIHGRKRNGEIHEGIEGFYRSAEPMQLSLLTLGGLSEVWAGEGFRPVVYVVENPSVFSSLISIERPISVICSNGQPRLAVLVLLDLVSRYAEILYAGDFDPEGLTIAQNLKRRYGERLQFWHYERRFYELAVSEVTLSEKRLKKLDGIEEAGLLDIRDAVKDTRKAAYQERLVEEYIRFVERVWRQTVIPIAPITT